MSKPIVAITHTETAVGKFYTPFDLQRLGEVAEIRILGSNDFAEIRDQLSDVTVLTGSWGMPELSPALLAAAPPSGGVLFRWFD